VEPRDFRPTAEQLRVFEQGGPHKISWVAGQRAGRRRATEMAIVAQAANPEEAELALEDLHTKGIACLTDEGKRVEPKGNRRFTVVKFDEERRTTPCPDCDGAGCEHCGDGRRRS